MGKSSESGRFSDVLIRRKTIQQIFFFKWGGNVFETDVLKFTGEQQRYLNSFLEYWNFSLSVDQTMEGRPVQA